MLVVLHHFSPTDKISLWNTFTNHTYLGVDIFFVLSGFVMAYVHHDLNGRFNQPGVFRGFLALRAGRIYPLYIIVTLACWPLAAANLLPFETALPVQRVVTNVLLIQGWGVDISIDNPGWSLSTEILAYLLFPLLLAAALSGRRTVVAGTACAVLAAYFVLASLSNEALMEGSWCSHASLNISDTRTLAPAVRCVAGFTLGLFTWRVLQNPRWHRVASSGPLCTAVAALLLCLLFAHGVDVVVVLLLPVLIGCLATERSAVARALASGPVHQLGVWSYALYLVHYPFVSLRYPVMHALHWLGVARTPVLAWAIVLGCMIAAAALLNRFVERPVQGAVRRWMAPAKARSLDGPATVPT